MKSYRGRCPPVVGEFCCVQKELQDTADRRRCKTVNAFHSPGLGDYEREYSMTLNAEEG